ncbi:MAG TPA: hypothetical protein VGC41_02180, partial [Kofleriaceae bacterium]
MKLAVAVLLATTALAHAAPPTDADLEACLGKDGTDVPALAAFHRGMTTDEANTAWAGAGKVDKYGFSSVKAKGCVGATDFKLYFQKDRTSGELALYSVSIDFDRRWNSNKDFYQRLVALLVSKFGEAKDEQVQKKLITWGTHDGIAQLTTLG